MKKITLQDIANKLNISKATVSIVLNGHGDEKRVSKETQEKIIQFARENNYKANHLARGLSLGKSDTIGLVVPNIGDSYFARIARRIERKARRSGYNVVYSSTGESKERESELISSMLSRGVDGLIIASSQKNQDDIFELKKSKIPFVLIDRNYPELETNYVGEDNEGGASQATNQLVKTGRKRIGFVTLKTGLDVLHQRLVGYQLSMEQNGLPIEDKWIRELDYEYTESDMLDSIKSMVQAPSTIEGIVFVTHFLAASGLRALKELNVRVPEDVAIVSFGQMNAFDLVDPPVTSVIQPVDELGDRAVEILLQNLDGETSYHRRIILNNRLEIRKSCGNL
ncbi:MAG: LacI family DNA-binding transcriptional regulator [Bacteroidota bacterium]|nr:LacI family DNA-binding transcriptional regulator [Bacteroidota bacterium]